jgi:hypothetical protein
MFKVEIAPEANAKLRTSIDTCGFIRPGLVIHRKGPVGDLTRTRDGNALWTIGRPDICWDVGIVSLEAYSDHELLFIDGIRVCLAANPRAEEKGIRIRMHDRKLLVEGIDV